jgi:hypothetical protein
VKSLGERDGKPVWQENYKDGNTVTLGTALGDFTGELVMICVSQSDTARKLFLGRFNSLSTEEVSGAWSPIGDWEEVRLF